MNEEGKNDLWEAYSKNQSSENKEKLILEYASLVKIVAGRLSMYLGHNVEYDDLVGYGIFGLIDAIDKFDYKKGIKFETYATLRIRGSIIDQIRKMDWLPRTLRQKQKKIDQAYQKIELQSGRVATDDEIAEELNISVKDLASWQSQTKVSALISLDEFLDQGSDIAVGMNSETNDSGPEQSIERKELKEMLLESLETLTEKEKKVVLLYYYEDLTLKEISLTLEVSESRVSQLHTKALQKLKRKLGNKVEMFNIF